jgi:hypothetical protein
MATPVLPGFNDMLKMAQSLALEGITINNNSNKNLAS